MQVRDMQRVVDTAAVQAATTEMDVRFPAERPDGRGAEVLDPLLVARSDRHVAHRGQPAAAVSS